jgi:hypothetical protein
MAATTNKKTTKNNVKTVSKKAPKEAKGSNADKKRKAYDLYMNTDLTQKEICELVAISEKTFTTWKVAANWEELKGAELITPQKIKINLYKKMYELSESGSIDADKLVKVASAIEKISDRKVTVSAIINTFKDFTTWLFAIDPELAKLVNVRQQEYINEKISK